MPADIFKGSAVATEDTAVAAATKSIKASRFQRIAERIVLTIDHRSNKLLRFERSGDILNRACCYLPMGHDEHRVVAKLGKNPGVW
jgi:hypothetical protein